MNYSVGDRLTVKIEKIVPGGFGLAFAEGLTIFVALAAAADRVQVELTQLKKRIAFAEIVEVIDPSPDRIQPPCVYFGRCGGCDFQQMSYSAQLTAKAAIIRDCLKRIGKIECPGDIPVIASPNEFHYRSRAQWHLDRQNRRLGYLRRNSHEVTDIETCLVLVPELDAELHRLRGGLEWERLWDDTKIDAAVGDEGTISLYSDEINEPMNAIASTAAGESFAYSAQAFFQGNRYMVEQLVNAALGDSSGQSAIDLYSGVGLFALPMARKFGQVIAIEENAVAVDFAEKNAANAGSDNIRFVRSSVSKALNDLRSPDLLLLDPPRSGAEARTIERIAELHPQHISYVSCEPSILARDLRILLDRGYSIGSITALDLFPQTHHVETVVKLKSI